MTLDDGLARTFAMVAGVMDGAVDRWWVIGSAAMAAQGVKVRPSDVDILLSGRDGCRVVDRVGGTGSAATGRFRSTPFLRWTNPPLVAEFMGDLEVRDASGKWVRVVPGAPDHISVHGLTVPIASLADLGDMCRLFGRPKDRERLVLIDTFKRRGHADGKG